MGRATNFKSNGWAVRDVSSCFWILQSVSVDQSGGFKYGDWCFVLVPRLHVISEPTLALEDEVLA